MPDYKFTIAPNMYYWRDLTPFGSSSTEKSLDYPFVNGCHYIYNNIMFPVKRQDPFGIWKLLWTKFPSDYLGNRITDKYNTTPTEDVC